ncbi:carbohydrate ABC transporter substrate-binding protein [Protaetiibacter sp. SSC-01]|uniref:ABC transporter substrate-binding protein n=1 Tax=Protaetiibacter sp. SSC-01 TaxID=2759943 RepID=UPI0016573D18|nr:ABC transporter substrate-binding protein [Protaetiibacter sp. SSC-01]QNO36900.1 carbohydrate ABC transporter substrate-binding protein [Protaetiibacter sp. SSC-01]
MQWNRKLTIGAATLAATGLLLAGCSAPGTESGGGATDDGTFLKIDWLANEKAGIDAVVAAFQEANPDIQVVVTTADTAQYQASIRTQLGTGTAADVFYVWPGDGNTAAIRQLDGGDFMTDLSDQDWVSAYPDFIRELVSIDGAAYIMAPLATAFAPVYNQAALDEAGLTAPTTWSDVIPFCEAASAAGKVAYALAGNNLYAGQAPYYALVADLVYGEGTEFDQELLDGKTTFSDHEGYVEATEKYVDMIDAGCFQPNATGTPYDESNRMVAQGEAFGQFLIGTRIAALQAVAPDGEFRIHPFHSDDDESTNAVTLSTQGGAAIYAKTPRQETAKKFVQFLADNIELYQAAMPGTVPTITEGYSPADANEEYLVAALDEGHAVHYLNQMWPNARIESAMVNGIQGLLVGSATPADMLASMQKEFDTK